MESRSTIKVLVAVLLLKHFGKMILMGDLMEKVYIPEKCERITKQTMIKPTTMNLCQL